ncbi:hypothetical protein HOP50_07g49670 [Chloropicon primus]|uniref:Uncharacterized protein n=1 Tax=Chloropicon primus TaxID=1764295 RepID=A0A5B8MPS0_9CHLO|nr:hypothetical protein A3770_07p49450 [Chloropicon primus]UPR01645.1 hypothetical protein HOP50_07g49670 [Chloropicon primus]|eukprot:QDZ22427.1 hypothetical protein A3770_07p49450 [Chloropicon primus]
MPLFQSVLNTESLRRRRREEGPGGGEEKSEPSGEEKTDGAKAKGKGKILTSSAEEDRAPDIFDTHVGPFLERYVLWCQKKGVILGWIPGLVGVAAFIAVAMVGGSLLGWATGQGIIKVLDYFGLVEKLRASFDALDGA